MKKKFMRMISMLMVLVMTLGMCVTGYAADEYTITVTNSVGGQTYNAYKVFDATYSTDGENVSYTIDSNSDWFNLVSESNLFELTATASDPTTYLVSVKEGLEDSEIINWFNSVDATGLTVDATAKGTGSSLILDVSDSGAGYYYVTSSLGSLVSLTTTTPEATIYEKNQKPGDGGSIPGDDNWPGGFTKDADGDSYSIGDTIDYVIRAYAPTYDNVNEITDYTFVDTMGAGLTMIETDTDGNVTSGVTVKIISSSGKEDSWVTITDYCTITIETDETTGEETLKVVYKIEDITGYPADAVVEISYQAYVNEAADETDITNSVHMSWNMKDPDGEDKEGETPDGDDPDITIYTYGFTLNKVDGNNEALNGASFTLTSESDTIQFIYDSTSKTYEVFDNSSAAATNASASIDMASGTVYIWGLGAGTYTLTEVVAPDGYNILTDTVTIVIADDASGWTVTYGGTSTFDDSDSNTFTTTYGTIDDTKDHGVATMASITIENNAGTSLPGTGGIGTTIFYVVGTLLVLAAAALVVAKMRIGKTE